MLTQIRSDAITAKLRQQLFCHYQFLAADQQIFRVKTGGG